jgi:hypothetical protein
MLEGNMFFEEQGMPILKMALKRMLLAEALPVPFSVAMQILRSLITAVPMAKSISLLPFV